MLSLTGQHKFEFRGLRFRTLKGESAKTEHDRGISEESERCVRSNKKKDSCYKVNIVKHHL